MADLKPDNPTPRVENEAPEIPNPFQTHRIWKNLEVAPKPEARNPTP